MLFFFLFFFLGGGGCIFVCVCVCMCVCVCGKNVCLAAQLLYRETSKFDVFKSFLQAVNPLYPALNGLVHLYILLCIVDFTDICLIYMYPKQL